MGLLPRPTRTSGGYREYPLSALKRVDAVRTALALGFSLTELSEVFQARDRGGAPCRAVRKLAGQKLELIENRLTELAAIRDLLSNVLRDWDERLAKARPGSRAGLLDALAENAGLRDRLRERPLEERFGHAAQKRKNK
jgi:DNA-binding transcriptional MerR regulator